MTPNSLFRASLLFAFIAAFPANQAHASTYQITKVINGQTIKFDNDGKIETARLIGIDTPGRSKSPDQPEQPFAASARNYLAINVLNRDVEIKAYGFDADGLLLVEVFIEDRNINFSMLRAGLAEAYLPEGLDSYQFNLYKKAENEAKQNRRGMWMQGKNFISPPEWKRMHSEYLGGIASRFA